MGLWDGKKDKDKDRHVHRAGGHDTGGRRPPSGRIQRRTGSAEGRPGSSAQQPPAPIEEQPFEAPQELAPPDGQSYAPPGGQPSLFDQDTQPAASPRQNLFDAPTENLFEEDPFGDGGEDLDLFGQGAPGAAPSLWDLAEEDGEEGAWEEAPPPKKRPKARRQRPQKAPSARKLAKAERRAERKRLRDLSRKEKVKRILLRLLVLFLGAAVVGCAAVGVFWFHSTRNDDLWLDLDQIPYKTETILYATDRQTGEVSEYAVLPCTQNKEYVESSAMPQHLKDAFVAIEDKKFYDHGGVDVLRTGYAMLNEVKRALTGSYIGGDEGRKLGASTINQQLVKNLTRDDEDSNMAGYLRKLREVYRAWKLDREYTKDEILSAYLNTISFTGNTAGVQAEAKKLFGKTVDQLTLAESASLAAITRNPARYNPNTNPEEHLERRNYVLGEMLDQDYISQSEHDAAVAEALSLTGDPEPRRPQYVTTYFTDAIMDEVVSALQSEKGLSRKEATNLLYNGGLRIYTTVVPELQTAMENVLQNNPQNVYPMPTITVNQQLTDDDGSPRVDEDGEPVMGDVKVPPQAAMVSLDYDGGVCAVVGGLGEKTISRGFNRGMDAVRQVGSTMKAIAPYVLAIEDNDITWSSAFLDDVVRQEEDEATGEKVDWPANVDRVYSGREILVREAFARSVNTIAVRVGDKVGNRRMYNFVVNDLGVSTFVREDAKSGPLVMGSSTYGITPLEMAKAYAMHGNGGYTVTEHTYTHITNGTGGDLVTNDTPTKQVISEETSFIMNRLMREVVTGDGTASGLSVSGEMDSVGKTGTTSDHRDHWFIGLTPYYVTASWYGYDENVALDVNYRSHPPTLAWRNVMGQAQQNLPYKEFPTAAGVTQMNYCTQSGTLAGANCPSKAGWYKTTNPPKSGCPIHGG